jgi:hypothetical protein
MAKSTINLGIGTYLLEELADGIGRDDRRYGPIPALRVRMRE